MHGVGVAEEVVQVAQYFLIRAHEEHTYIIMLLVGETMQRDGVLRRFGNEIGDFAVAVAGDVLKGGKVRWVFIKPLDRDDGEKLVDGPKVGQRLEQGEVRGHVSGCWRYGSPRGQCSKTSVQSWPLT